MSDNGKGAGESDSEEVRLDKLKVTIARFVHVIFLLLIFVGILMIVFYTLSPVQERRLWLTIGTEFIVGGGLGLLIAYVTSQDLLRLITRETVGTLEKPLAENIRSYHSKELRPLLGETVEESVRRGQSVRVLVGLKEAYLENIRLLRRAKDADSSVWIYAVGADMDHPASSSDDLASIVREIQELLGKGTHVNRIQVQNAPVNWLRAMAELTVHDNPLNVSVTNEDPFIPQLVLVEGEQLLLLPTETEMGEPFGFILEYSAATRQVFKSARRYLQQRFFSGDQLTSDAFFELIDDLEKEKRRILAISMIELGILTELPEDIPEDHSNPVLGRDLKSHLRRELAKRIEDGDRTVQEAVDRDPTISRHVDPVLETLRQSDCTLFAEIYVAGAQVMEGDHSKSDLPGLIVAESIRQP